MRSTAPSSSRSTTAASRPATTSCSPPGSASNISGYGFLPDALLQRIDQVDGYPRLSPGFETSVPNLYIVGAPAAWSFGPLMRFVVGSEYVAPALARAILGSGTNSKRT